MILLFATACESNKPMKARAPAVSAPNATVPSCSSDVLACVQGRSILNEDLDRAAGQLNPLLARQYRTRAGRVELLNALIERELLEGEARKRGIHEREAVRRQVDDYQRRLTAKILAEELPLLPPSESRMRSYYDEHLTDFVQPERFSVTRVALVGETLERTRAALSGGATASALTTRGSPAKSLQVAKSDVPASAWLALHKALAGDKVTEPVKMGGVVYLLRVDGHSPARSLPFEKVKPRIIERLAPAQRRLAIQALGQQLREQRSVEVHLENLD